MNILYLVLFALGIIQYLYRHFYRPCWRHYLKVWELDRGFHHAYIYGPSIASFGTMEKPLGSTTTYKYRLVGFINTTQMLMIEYPDLQQAIDTGEAFCGFKR